MTDEAKRETLTLLSVGTAGALMTGLAGAQNVNTPPPIRKALSSGREPKPLGFDPARLDGLSEKLIRSHWENNYIGSVKTLNMISERLAAALLDTDLPPVVYGGL